MPPSTAKRLLCTAPIVRSASRLQPAVRRASPPPATSGSPGSGTTGGTTRNCLGMPGSRTVNFASLDACGYPSPNTTGVRPTAAACSYSSSNGNDYDGVGGGGAASGLQLNCDYLHCAAEPFYGNGIVRNSYIISDECWGPCGSGSRVCRRRKHECEHHQQPSLVRVLHVDANGWEYRLELVWQLP